MKDLIYLIMGVLLAILMLVSVTKTAMAQDVVKVAPESYKVLLENDRVRVLEYRLDVIPVEVLGNIYEQYLGYTFRLTDHSNLGRKSRCIHIQIISCML